MPHPAAEPDEPDDERDVSAIRVKVAQRLRSLPSIPSDEERARNPLALFEFQLELERCRREDTVEAFVRDEERKAADEQRRLAYESREDYVAQIADAARQANDTSRSVADSLVRFEQLVTKQLKEISADVQAIRVEQRAQGTEVANLAGRERDLTTQLQEHIASMRGEVARLDGRIDELERLVWEDAKARSKEAHHGGPASTPTTRVADDPGDAGGSTGPTSAA